MSTTTIRLENPLRTRVRAAAAYAGTSPHSFMLAAIEEKTRQAELRRDFHEDGERRWAEFRKSGRGIPWEEMREYLKKRVSDPKAHPPKARKLTRF